MASKRKAGGFEVEEATLAGIHRAMRAGKITARSLVTAYRKRIRAYDQQGPMLNSVVSLHSKAHARAGALDAALADTGKLQGPLHGIPVLLKDNSTPGVVSRAGDVVMC